MEPPAPSLQRTRQPTEAQQIPIMSTSDSQTSTVPGDSIYEVPCFSISSSPDDEMLLAAATQVEAEEARPGHAHGGIRGRTDIYDPLQDHDAWADARLPKSPRVNLGKGRWDQGPIATALGLLAAGSDHSSRAIGAHRSSSSSPTFGTPVPMGSTTPSSSHVGLSPEIA